MAAEQDDLQLLVAALTAALRRSGWYDRASLQDALYGWAASGLSVGEVRAWLAADIADPTVALAFRELGIGPDEVHAAEVGEQVTIGRLPIGEAARLILGPHAASDTDQWRVALRNGRLADVDKATRLKARHAWRQSQIRRLDGLLGDRDAPPALAAWLAEQPDRTLLSYRDLAVAWAAPLTMAVARQELDHLGGPPGPDGPAASAALWTLVFGALSIRELTRRLGGRVEAAIMAPPAYLTALLGPYPDAAAAQLLWTRAVLAIETFRQDCEITDPEHALGTPDAWLPLSERLRYRQLNRALPGIGAELERARLDAQHHRRDGRLPGPADTTGDSAGTWPQTTTNHWQDADSLLDPDAMRPDQELAEQVGSWIWQHPAAQRAAQQPPAMAPDFSDKELAAWWAILPERHRRWTANLADEILAARWNQAVERHLQDATQDLIRNHGRNALAEAATLLSEIDRRVTTRVRTVMADPPVYLTSALGPRPAAGDDSGMWECLATEIEQYRLLTGTTTPAEALGATPTPTSSWQQSWRRELAGNLADAYHARMHYQHRVIGTPQERNHLAVLTTSMIDPWLGVRPNPAMVEVSAALAIGELHHRVATALPLLAQQPENPSSELRAAQLRHARLLAYRQDEQVALAAARARRAELRWTVGLGARLARAAAADTIRRHEQALADLDNRLAEIGQDLVRLQQAQAAYFDWSEEQALQVAQGQAAAQALQARESSLLADLAAHPPTYLVVELGQPPTNPDGRAAWLRGARAIERYRAAYGVCDRDEAFGAWYGPRRWEPPDRQRDQDWTRAFLDDIRRAITDSLARELNGLSMPGPDDGLGD